MFNPTISPHDAKTVLVSCDMTGAYITHDGGNSWRMFNLRGLVHFFVFDPIDFKTIYVGTNILWRSTDNRETWNLIYPKPSAVKGLRMNPARFPGRDSRLYAATGKGKSFAVFVSGDFGSTWKELDRLS
jgi:hypothetical protein